MLYFEENKFRHSPNLQCAVFGLIYYENKKSNYLTNENSRSNTFSTYYKVASSNTFCFEAQADFFRLLMKGIFDPYVL